MMMKLLKLSLVIGAVALLAPVAAEAHVLKTDGSIGAVLHVDPADDPVAGQSTEFIFEMKDKQNKFSTTACDCSFSVFQAGKQIISQPIDPSKSDASSVVASYTFPERGVYQIALAGKPNVGASFQPFNLQYDIRVARTSGNSQPGGGSKLIYWMIGVLGAVVIGSHVIKMRIKSDDKKII